MDQYSDNEYVLVMEDRSQCKSEQEVGKLSVVLSKDAEKLAGKKQGQQEADKEVSNPQQQSEAKLKGVEPKQTKEAEFLKFHDRDGVLGNFLKNFLAQFNAPKHIGLYKLLTSNIEEGVSNLRELLSERDKPENKAKLDELRVDPEQQDKKIAINPERVDWKMLETLGLSKEKLEQNGELDKMLNWQKTNLLPIAIPVGETTIHTEARLAFRTDEEGKISLAVHSLRKEPQLDFPYMGHKFSNEEKETLLATGNLGKTIEVTPKNGEPFSAYVSIDPQTNEVIALRADRVSIPKEIKGVTLSDQQYKDLIEGKAVKVEGMTSKNGKSFDATLQVNAEKKGIEFIFGDKKSLQERKAQHQEQGQKQGGIPRKLCGLTLSDKQREALNAGSTLYLKNMVDKEGKSFNAYVRMDKEENRPRFYKWNPDKKQDKGKVEAVAEENKTQVAVNNHGKTNEATKDLKEPLKSQQTQPTEAQQAKQEQKAKRGRKM